MHQSSKWMERPTGGTWNLVMEAMTTCQNSVSAIKENPSDGHSLLLWVFRPSRLIPLRFEL